MGPSQSKGPSRQMIASAPRSCDNDEYCKNISSYKSEPGNVVYSCPDATCKAGMCDCGSGCKLDAYSGSCCQGLEKVGDIEFCVEITDAPNIVSTTSDITGADSTPIPTDEQVFQGQSYQLVTKNNKSKINKKK